MFFTIPGFDTVEAAWSKGAELVARVNAFLAEELGAECVLKMELEKVMQPLLMLEKKKYVGVKHEKAKEGFKSELMYKGVEITRRDACDHVRATTRAVVEALMSGGPDALRRALVHIRDAAMAIAEDRVPRAALVVTQALKSPEDYADGTGDTQAAVAVNRLRIARGEPAYFVGDRVPYIHVCRRDGHGLSEKAKVVERVDDPTHPAIMIDRAKYVGMLCDAALRYLEPIVPRLANLDDLVTWARTLIAWSELGVKPENPGMARVMDQGRSNAFINAVVNNRLESYHAAHTKQQKRKRT